MELLIWILLGMISGMLVASIMHDGESFIGLADVLLGMLGAVIAGIITNIFTSQNVAGLYDQTMLLAVIGSSILIWLGRKIILNSNS